MSKKITSLQKLPIEEIEESKTEDDLGIDLLIDDEPIEAIAPTKSKPPKEPKPRPPRTPKQIEVFEKAKLKRMENVKMKNEIRAEEELKKKKEQEDLIVRKAIAIKKRELKKKAILDEIEEDDTPIEKIREIAKKVSIAQPHTPPPATIPPPPLTYATKYRFVKI